MKTKQIEHHVTRNSSLI